MELAWKLASGLVLTVIIVANVWERNNPRTEFSRLLWGRFPALMYVGMAFLGILVAFSMIDAAVMMGWVAPGTANAALPVLGIPMAILAVAVLVMAGRAVLQVVTRRRGRHQLRVDTHAPKNICSQTRPALLAAKNCRVTFSPAGSTQRFGGSMDMSTWWPLIGETSVIGGSTLGFLWALASTSRRRRKFLRAAMPPRGQVRWFLVNLVSMSCYLTLVGALGLASLHGFVPVTLFWFLLGASSLAFMSALLFPTVDVGRLAIAERRPQEPPVTGPPEMPVRRTA